MTDACHLCRRSLGDALPVHDQGRTGPLATVCCRGCTLVQTVPHATPEAVAAYYSSGAYRAEYPPLPVNIGERSVAPTDPDYERALDAIAEAQADRLIETWSLAPTDRIVEYGCGEGRVSAALMRRGHLVRCVELDPAMRESAETRGCVFDVERGVADFVFAMQVVEHFANPLAGLSDVASYAKRGAVVVVEVPCVERPYHSLTHFFQRPHVVTYSQSTLSVALVAVGLGDVRISIDGTVLVGEGRYLVENSSGAMGHPPAEAVVEGLHAWERARTAAPMVSPLPAFLAGGDVDPATVHVLRDEVRRHVNGAGDALRSFSDLAGLYDDGMRSDPWHTDPWVAGFRAGKLTERQAACTAISNVVAGLALNLTRPELVLMMGAPGSGKTTIAKSCHRTRFMPRLDVDEMPGATRPERVAAALDRQERTLARRQNLVIDSTGRTPSIWVELAEKMIGAGYRVLVVYASCPLDVCLARVEARGRETMPREMIVESHAAIVAGFPLVAAVCQGAAMYDTSGAEPVLVEAGGCW